MAHSSVALLDMPAGRAVDGFEATANTLGLMAERQGDTLRVSLRLGTVDVAGDGDGTRISIASETAAQLQSLRDLLALRLSQRGLHLAWQEGATGRPANMSLARVEGIERISPSYMRVTIMGPDLGRFARRGMHFRLLFGPEGAGWPELDAGGLTQWPAGVEAWHRPVYTTRQIDRTEGDAAAASPSFGPADARTDAREPMARHVPSPLRPPSTARTRETLAPGRDLSPCSGIFANSPFASRPSEASGQMPT